jgi:hypothetical protein
MEQCRNRQGPRGIRTEIGRLRRRSLDSGGVIIAELRPALPAKESGWQRRATAKASMDISNLQGRIMARKPTTADALKQASTSLLQCA